MVTIGVTFLPNLRSQRELLSHGLSRLRALTRTNLEVHIEASHATAHNPHKSQNQSHKVRLHFWAEREYEDIEHDHELTRV